MNITSQCDLFLLQDAVSHDKIKSDVLNEIISMTKKEKVNEVHKFKITEPTTQKGRWQTYCRDEEKGRIKITATTEKGLYDKLYFHYYEDIPVTLSTLYPEWLEHRKLEAVADSTIHRNMNHWDKYYKNDPIVNIPIIHISSEMIEDFFYGMIKKFNMTSKEVRNVKFIIACLFEMARRRKIIPYNPYTDVCIKTTGCRPITKHKASTRVYLPEEKEALFKVLNEELTEHPNNTDAYLVFLLFKLGLRIGEATALKWEDIDWDDKEIHIHRMEAKENNDDGKLRVCVVEHTKKKSASGDRFLPLGDYEVQILHKVKEINTRCNYKESEYIFCDHNGRTKIRAIDNLLRKSCELANIPVKSAHDIRRTVASEMHANDVPLTVIQDFLGHSDMQTTIGYIYDNKSRETTNNTIRESLKNMNGLKCTQIS